MDDHLHREPASLDKLIDWLRNQRSGHPDASLASLLAGHAIDTPRLLDLACIDLIERRRLGQAIRVESYVEQFPQLKRNDRLLDLIDAEICIAGELQQPIDPVAYQQRFPELAKEVFELTRLDSLSVPSGLLLPVDQDVRSPPSESTRDGETVDPSASFSVELVVKGDRQASDALPMSGGHPLHAPEWFSAEKCFASGPGRWLIRGRDSQRGAVMAMKVIQLSASLHPAQSHQILDACEAASQVRNPMWIPPTVAAIQHRHLGVIRAWVFAVSWQPIAVKRDVASQLGDLASIAYCLEAAHRVGATHGAIHGENVLLDHDGKLRLVDAVANHDGMRRWLDEGDARHSEPMIMSLPQRKRTDLEDLIRMIASISASWRQAGTGPLIDELAKIADGDPEGAAGNIGDLLMQYSDTPTKASTHPPDSWRQIWKRWLRDQP